MIEIQLELKGEALDRSLVGRVWNASGIAARSDYGFSFAGRESSGDVLLRQYPRWCEPVRVLVARCLALSKPPAGEVLACNWEYMILKIALRPGGRDGELLDTVVAERTEDGELSFIRGTTDGGTFHLNAVKPRASYADAWDLADHALRVSTFHDDELPAPKELKVPVRRQDGLSFICTRDIPEPARSVFEKRMWHSTRPVVPGYPDAVYVWDWLDFLGGRR